MLFQVGKAHVLSAVALLAAGAAVASAQDNQFGVLQRADAARQMIVLGVQQGISSLPPTSGQAFAYDYDPKLGAMVASKRLGPTSFRSASTVGEGNLSVRAAFSYFELAESLGPIDYRVDGVAPDPLRTRFGTKTSAKVSLLNLAANYGITKTIEVALNLPIVVTDVSASERFISFPGSDVVQGVRLSSPPDTIDRRIDEGTFIVNKLQFDDIQGTGFKDGTNAGVGRINLGLKWMGYADEMFQVSLAPELYFPSPSEDEYAGSESAAFLPRVITAVKLSDVFRLHVDAGYDLDFEEDELRRFVWNFGGSAAFSLLTIDAGFGGSKFNEGIKWTPDHATFVDVNGNTSSITAIEDNRLGSNFVDFLGGVKVPLTDTLSLSGAVNVPINEDGFRADAVGTIALEVTL